MIRFDISNAYKQAVLQFQALEKRFPVQRDSQSMSLEALRGEAELAKWVVKVFLEDYGNPRPYITALPLLERMLVCVAELSKVEATAEQTLSVSQVKAILLVAKSLVISAFRTEDTLQIVDEIEALLKQHPGDLTITRCLAKGLLSFYSKNEQAMLQFECY